MVVSNAIVAWLPKNEDFNKDQNLSFAWLPKLGVSIINARPNVGLKIHNCLKLGVNHLFGRLN